MLRLILGRAGTGKTALMLDELCERVGAAMNTEGGEP